MNDHSPLEPTEQSDTEVERILSDAQIALMLAILREQRKHDKPEYDDIAGS